MRRAIFAVAIMLASAVLLVSCKSLNAIDPADMGNVPAQLMITVHNATTQPAVQDGAAVVAAATGQPWIPIATSALGALGLILAGVFHSKYSQAQSHLDVAQSSTGTDNNSDAIAKLVTDSSIAKGLNTAAEITATAAPIVGAMIPRTAQVAAGVAEVAQAVQAATTPPVATPPPPVSIAINTPAATPATPPNPLASPTT